MKDKLVACRWKDKRDVFMISTFHGKRVAVVEPHKPEVIQEYNQYMNGVDCKDQLLSYYS